MATYTERLVVERHVQQGYWTAVLSIHEFPSNTLNEVLIHENLSEVPSSIHHLRNRGLPARPSDETLTPLMRGDFKHTAHGITWLTPQEFKMIMWACEQERTHEVALISKLKWIIDYYATKHEEVRIVYWREMNDTGK